MITVPLIPQLRVFLTVAAPLIVYAFWYFLWPKLAMSDPNQRGRMLWLLAIIPLFPVFVIGIDLRAVLTHLFPTVYVHIGPIRDPALYQRLYPGQPAPPSTLPIWLIVILAARIIGLIYAVVFGIGEYLVAIWRLKQLPQYEQEGVVILDVDGWFGFAFGLFRPRIYLSRAVWNSPHRQAIRTHEEIHVRRLDPLRRTILQTIRRLLWFLPYWGRLIDQIHFEREQSCDREACRRVKKSAYARALLAFAENAIHDITPTPLATSFMSHLHRKDAFHLLVARLRAIATPSERRTPAWLWPAFVIVYLGLAIIA